MGKRIFSMEFSSSWPKFRPQSHKWNSKIWENFEKKKKSAFFFWMWLDMSHDVSKKNNFQSFIYSIQSPRIYFGPNYNLKRIKMDFEETSYFSNVRKNDQNKFHIFGKDFSVKKSEKKIAKKNNFYFFLCFFNRFFFFMENGQTGSKISQTWQKHVFMSF